MYEKLQKRCMSVKIRKTGKCKRIKRALWTDKDFFSLRKTVNRLGSKLKKSRYDLQLRLKFLYYTKQLKRMKKTKKRAFKQTIRGKINSISNKDSKQLWQVLKILKPKSNDNCEDPPNWQEFIVHFKNLGNQNLYPDTKFKRDIQLQLDQLKTQL